MTIIQALQEVNASMSSPFTLIYADLNEANLDADKLVNSELPCLIVFPITPVDKPGKSGVLKTTFIFDGMFLTKHENTTTDYKSIDVEIKTIAPMRMLAREFMFRLNEHDIIDPEGDGIQERPYKPVYSSMDADLFGVWVTATVPIMEQIMGCNHA